MCALETQAGSDDAAATTTPDSRVKLRHRALPIARYLLSTDVHTFAFSVAANAILSFFPFVVLLLTITSKVLHSPAMTNMVLDLLRDYLPVGQDFVIRNLKPLVAARKSVQVASFVMLLITSTGVFLPLEVALNRVWGFTKNRSYLLNQLVSLGLAFAGGVLALLSVALAAGNQHLLEIFLLGPRGVVFRALGWLVMKAIAIVASITIFFLIYWLLPNGHVRARAVAPTAIVTGLLWELAKYGYILALPLAELPGSLRAVFHFGDADVLGLPLRLAAARRSLLERGMGGLVHSGGTEARSNTNLRNVKLTCRHACCRGSVLQSKHLQWRFHLRLERPL